MIYGRSDPDYVGTAISNGSFSKIFGPGMRLGWLEAPQKVRNIILSTGLAASGGSFNHTAAGIMASVIELGLLDNLLKEARPMYRVRSPIQVLCVSVIHLLSTGAVSCSV